MRMLRESLICWTPKRELYAPGFRGKIRIFPAGTPEEHWRPFAHRAGSCDARAHDARLEVRQTYALTIANVLVLRDGLDAAAVHKVMLEVEEYVSGTMEETLQGALHE
jgi:hypothetical protein